MPSAHAATTRLHSWFPLRLCQVLEKEFTTTHGPLPDAPTWLLKPGDVASRKLVEYLQATVGSTTPSPLSFIRQKLEQGGLDMHAAAELGGDTADPLRERLNALLQSHEALYDFRLLNSGAEARQLAEIYGTRGRHSDSVPTSPRDAQSASRHIGEVRVEPADSDRTQLNRLLLEAVLPADVVARVDTSRLTSLFDKVHGLRGPEGANSALSLSGGGIRSASYALGVLQGLARCGVLEKFDYLSTVSGGGYVGSWLSTWIHRHPEGLTGVVGELAARGQKEAGNLSTKVEPEPAPIGFLRDYSHFLNPRAGLFTVDTWTWIGIYLRNLSLNWLVIIPLLLVMVALPRLYAALLYDWTIAHGDFFPLLVWIATLAAVLTLVCVTVNRPSTGDPAASSASMGGKASYSLVAQAMQRFRKQGWLLVFGVLPMFVFAILLTLLVWGLPSSQIPLSWIQIRAVLSGTPALQLPTVLAHVGFEHLVLWGELIVFAGWILAIALLPARDWIKRLQEMIVMLLAGALTWVCVSSLADFASTIGTTQQAVFRLWSFAVYPAHVYSVLAVPTIVVAVLAGMTLFIGAVSKFKWIEDEDREWWGRFGSWILIVTTAWMGLSTVTILGPPLLLEFPRMIASIGGVSGLIAVLLGKSSLTSASGHRNPAKRARRNPFTDMLVANALPILSVVFLAVFLAFLSLLSSALLVTFSNWLATGPNESDGAVVAMLRHLLPAMPVDLKQACGLGNAIPPTSVASVFSDPQIHLELVCQSSLGFVGVAVLATGALLVTASLLINLNKFSLHAAYRIRIVRTFLGASRGKQRQPNPFTGFDPLDDVQMHELQPGLIREADIVDLPRFVGKLKLALTAGASPAQYVARAMCSRGHDRSGVLEGRLKAYTVGDPVLKSLQQDVIESLNRVLEVARLDKVDAFRSLSASSNREAAVDATLERFARHGNLIFANRLLLEIAFPEDLRKYDFPPPPPHKLLHVVNLTLNLVHGSKLAWQERKAAPFVVTPMHAGSYYLGYREARDYGGEDGISIGTAVAVSGAAVSPNMGYSSSPLTALLLTLFNVRLGWWLGNPGIAGSDTYHRAEPRFSLRPLLSEALGLTDDQSPYAYLSDGGHFENMGLFEMVLRRCHLIVCTDAGADPEYQFADIGNAARKIRIDLGIPIEFTSMPIHRRADHEDATGRYCAIGRIRYSYVDGEQAVDGVLILFKPVVCGKEPADVLNYAATNKAFPQEPTVDQFFGESQFESYRKLGEFSVDSVCAGRTFTTTDPSWASEFVACVQGYLGETAGHDVWLEEWCKRMAEPGTALNT